MSDYLLWICLTFHWAEILCYTQWTDFSHGSLEPSVFAPSWMQADTMFTGLLRSCVVRQHYMLFWSCKRWLSISCNLKISGVCLIYSLGFQPEFCNVEKYSCQKVNSSSVDIFLFLSWCYTTYYKVQIIMNDRDCLWRKASCKIKG